MLRIALALALTTNVAFAASTDAERRAAASTLIYQAKLSGGLRQAGSAWACGFATDDCVDKANSSSYAIDFDSKMLKPTTGTGSMLWLACPTPIEDSHFGSFGAALAFDGNAATGWASAQFNGNLVGVSSIGCDLGAGNGRVLAGMKITQQAQTGAVFTKPISSVRVYVADASMAWSEVAGSPFALPADVSQQIVSWTTVGNVRAAKVVANANTPAGGYAWGVAELAFGTAEVGATGMTVRTTPAPQTGTITAVRGLLEVDAEDGLSADVSVDLELDVSCDGGGWFVAAPLTVVGRGQAGRTLVESDSVPCGAPGTSMVGVVTTWNNKRTFVAGVALTAAP